MTDPLAAKRRLLAEQLDQVQRAAVVLLHSWNKVDPARIGEPDPDLEEILEAVCARFTRLEDLLIKRIFRAVAALELADVERLWDVLDLMERLRLIESAEQWVELRDLRNTLVHEDAMDDLQALQRRVYLAVPVLLQALQRISGYTAQQSASSARTDV